jgi:hypothetical protein
MVVSLRVGFLLDPLGQPVEAILSPSDRPTGRQRLWAAVALLVLLGVLIAFVWWRNR